ncbi:hypothetical protein TRIATDRAFT_143259 [Trichoderma atroviride IMI 206040]|uniref:Autophagy-related protein 2 n=1 Tax=Hypocrea atroviridis (strain ATCC 20476 / IMI 206040) TaxID=452589 RepID=G9PCM3_HYPAI|nr:uncharacterized protein TRIATDRAFT_143259 [Trichoderma atroviride IMI 206040]EHK39595.1 hypothetical protein TRIATDRAFT_143259 [Trichoderma atroviride IMI 206040]
MAGLFQSFRSSSMPKRLLRYALSRLELLDSDALDMDNLDLALGRNTVFEFRDVGVQLDKLEKLLKLPRTFALQKAKVLLLRVTIPMDFYTSPISIEVDGVDVKLKVLVSDAKSKSTKSTTPDDASAAVPNTVDLAQSFLETQPSSERKKLEAALAAEAQDLGASTAMSDDSSEDEPIVGTGQPLSLPGFLAGFLQGIMDRMQIKIKGVRFQLDMDIPVDLHSSVTEPVSFQIALEGIDIEGVTTRSEKSEASPAAAPKEGKRQISLDNVRAYLVSEANVFSTLTRSSSMTSPSDTSSPHMTRNPPSRQTTSLSSENHLTDEHDAYQPDYPLGDSEEALGIPYEFEEDEDQGMPDDESPATPRASMYQDFNSPDDAGFHSPEDPAPYSSPPRSMFNSTISRAQDAFEQDFQPSYPMSRQQSNLEGHAQSLAELGNQDQYEPENLADDLTQSHLYTHEEAESMYMSAFSKAESEADISELRSSKHSDASTVEQAVPSSVEEAAQVQIPPSPQEFAMPGGWDDNASEGSSASDRTMSPEKLAPKPEEISEHEAEERLKSEPGREKPGSPVFGQTSIAEDASIDIEGKPQHEDVATPKGPTRVVKEILHLSSISIYVPTTHQHIEIEEDNSESVAELARAMGNSVYPQAPGAFSVHAPTSGSVYGHRPSIQSTQSVDNVLEIDLSPVSIRFDASLAFVLAMIVGKLLDAVKQDNPVKVSSSGAENEQHMDKTPEIKVTVQEISLDFLSRLGGVADTPRRHLDSSAFMFAHEVLLNATLSGLTIGVSPTKVPVARGGRDMQDAIQTKIDLQTFRFGYAKDDIISFDKVEPMSTSVRDTFISHGHDVGIRITQTKKGVKTEIEALPLAVRIDLQKLDETFSWFGGLSSFLNMSASMTSSPSPTPKSPHKSVSTQRPKGVRFDTPIKPDDKSAAFENKIDMRIGGSFVELLGKECSFIAKSGSISLVSREEGMGIVWRTMRVSGPYLKNSMADPAIMTDINGVRLEFVTIPTNSDLEKLLELITPSKAKFDHGSDEIMVDTLLRQRRKGSVLRATIDTLNVRVKNMAQFEVLPALAEEVAKLSTVAKYLPEDDRPGLMTLATIHKLGTSVDLGGTFGQLSCDVRGLEAAHITVPSLVAVAVSGISVRRNETEELINSSILYSSAENAMNRGPVIMARMIGDDIEPVVKLNLQDVSIEYRVPTIMDILGLANDATPQDFEESLAASVASLGDQAHAALARPQPQSPTEVTAKQSKPMTLDVSFRNCLVGLNPLNQKSKMVLVFTDAHLSVTLPKDEVTKVNLDINKASILLTDDATLDASDDRTLRNPRRRSSSSATPQVISLCAEGYVDICYMSSAKVVVNVAPGLDGEKQVEIEVRDDLLVLETCADSTQTLISLANALSPPTPPSKENKYRTKVVPVQDLLASISAEAFGRPEGEYDFDQDFSAAREMARSQFDTGSESDGSLPIESQFYGDETAGEELFDAMNVSSTSQDPRMQDTNEGVLISGLESSTSNASEDGEGLVIHDDFYNRNAAEEHTAKIWNSNKNTYDRAPAHIVKRSPLKVSVRDVHVIWNLFDGYDWIHTRNVINKAVHDLEHKAFDRQAGLANGQVHGEEREDEDKIDDFLFNSIYIGIPANRDPQELARAINEGLADNMTETESVATTAVTATSNRTVRRGYPKSQRLKLRRSKRHKITFELRGVNVDMVAFPAGTGETQSSIDVRVENLDIFDHVPTSTWKKFATYDQDQGEREMGTSMVHLELLTVQPIAELKASEIVLRATVLPLRLHVDQDALDFITRFFEFKDESVPVHSSPSDVPFLQRAEVNDIPVKLDFKPKRVDYAGLRSGHTTEFMNFITLEESRLVLRHVIIYGVSGFDRLGLTLNDIWTPDVRSNQLPGVLGGLAPVRSLVNIGSGFRELIEVPLKEYQKDGRIIRSISKGAVAFARTTGTELVKFGAKLAVGTQYALQGAEEMLGTGRRPEEAWDDDDLDADDKKQISLYADHPTGVIQGIRGGYRSLARDVNLARDAIIAVPGEVMESQSASGAAKAVLRRAPTIIFRPAMGVTKAIGQTLMGATNSIDPHNQRRIDEKYKKH